MSIELLAKLSEPFKVEEVKQRNQGGRTLDYISIDATIRRFNEVLGTDWATVGVDTSVILLPHPDNKGNPQYLATVSLTLKALEKEALGVGADVATDPDKAVKTALAEALKKAGHQFGVGLYLWEEEARDRLVMQRKAASGDLGTLQALVKDKYMSERREDPSAPFDVENMCKHYGIKDEDLRDTGALLKLLA